MSMHIVPVATYSVAWSIDTVFLTIHIVAEAIDSVTFTSYSVVLSVHIATDINFMRR